MNGHTVPLAELNKRGLADFVTVCGPLFELSPWIAARTWPRRPFPSIDALYRELVRTLEQSTEMEKLDLIMSHPDLVGRLAREGKLSAESTTEQAAAGLDSITPQEAALFEKYNLDYRRRFGFPFVICARENRKEAILAAFPERLAHTRDQEVQTALEEIEKIARLRLIDAVAES